MKKLLVTGLLLLATTLSASASASASVNSENDAYDLLDSLSSLNKVEMLAHFYFYADGDLEDALSTTTILEWYESPHNPFKFIVDNHFPDKRLFIKKIKCAYEYTNVLGESDGTGSNGGYFHTVSGNTAMLDADRSGCVRKFGCSYTIGVEGFEAERDFSTKLNLNTVPGTANMCLVHARMKVKG